MRDQQGVLHSCHIGTFRTMTADSLKSISFRKIDLKSALPADEALAAAMRDGGWREPALTVRRWGHCYMGSGFLGRAYRKSSRSHPGHATGLRPRNCRKGVRPLRRTQLGRCNEYSPTATARMICRVHGSPKPHLAESSRPGRREPRRQDDEREQLVRWSTVRQQPIHNSLVRQLFDGA